MHLRRVPLGAVAVELLLPFHHVGAAAVLLDQPADAIAALALAARAFDTQHVELALDVAKDEIGSGLPIKVVQHRLGHSSITMTSDIYGHLFPSGDDGVELAAAERALLG